MSTKSSKSMSAPGLKGKPGKSSMLVSDASPFHIREAFKTVRSNLLFTLATKDSKAVTISSALPSEGKSTTGSNLAIALALTGAQVLLVDCDLRKPVEHRLFKLSIEKGLTSILCGMVKIEEAVHQNVYPNLDIITAGPMSPNPSELLGSAQMSEFLKIVQKAYDYVILDTPPINVVSDGLLVAQQTAGLMLVTRQEQSRHEELKKAVANCKLANVTVLGIVVNDVKSKGSYHSYRYNQYGRSDNSGK